MMQSETPEPYPELWIELNGPFVSRQRFRSRTTSSALVSQRPMEQLTQGIIFQSPVGLLSTLRIVSHRTQVKRRIPTADMPWDRLPCHRQPEAAFRFLPVRIPIRSDEP